MRKAAVGITAEGVPSIGLSAFAALLFAVLGWASLSMVFFLLTVFCCSFFRDPERVSPQGDGLAVSPADGKIVRIATMPDPLGNKPRTCICVFMSVFNVHVNRSPVASTVRRILYYPGRYFNAALDKASYDNERCAYALRDAEGNDWTMVQIAGLIARRIVCRVDVGESLGRGERFGMIKFGSRVDLYLPEGYSPKVFVGQKVVAGETVLAARDTAE